MDHKKSALQKTMNWFKQLPFWRRIVIVALIVLFLAILPGLHERATWLYGEANCARTGGTWEMRGIAHNQLCIRTYPDAGKACRSSDECMGGCVLYEDIWGEPAPAVGVCKSNNDPFECYAVIEYPEFYHCAD